MSEPMSDAEFAEIVARMFDAAQAIDEDSPLAPMALALCGADVPALVAEVERLRASRA